MMQLLRNNQYENETGGYEDALLAEQVLRTVEQHDTRQPYFLYWSVKDALTHPFARLTAISAGRRI